MYVCIFSGDEIECYLSIQGMYGYKYIFVCVLYNQSSHKNTATIRKNRMMLKTVSFGKNLFGRIRIYPVTVLIDTCGDRIQNGGQSRRVPASRKVGDLKFLTRVAEIFLREYLKKNFRNAVSTSVQDPGDFL